MDSWVRKIPLRRHRLPTPEFLGFPCGSEGKESTCNMGDLGSIPGLGRSPGEGNGYQLQCSGLENSMNCIVHGVTKNRTQLSDFHFQVSTKSAALASGAPSLAVMRVRCEDERRVRKMQCCSFEDRRRGHKPRNVK